MAKRLTWEQMQEMYPDKWLIIKDAEKDGSTLISGIIVDVCTDKTVMDKFIGYLNEGKHYIKRRTTEAFSLGVIYAKDYSIEVR